MADLSFLGTSCSRSPCCGTLVVGVVLVGVAVISLLLRVPFPASIVSTLRRIPRQYESLRPSRIEVGLPVYRLAPLENV